MSERSIQGRMMGFVQDLFDEDSTATIKQLFEKWKVSGQEFGYWLRDKRFMHELVIRLKWARRENEIFMARYVKTAAAKLIILTESRNSETARRACLDILNFVRTPRRPGRPPGRPRKPVPERAKGIQSLTDAKASRLLAALAESPG